MGTSFQGDLRRLADEGVRRYGVRERVDNIAWSEHQWLRVNAGARVSSLNTWSFWGVVGASAGLKLSTTGRPQRSEGAQK